MTTEQLVDSIIEHAEYGLYDLDPLINRPLTLEMVQKEVKEDLENIIKVAEELRKLI